MFSSVFKKSFWIVYDNLFVVLWSSFLWSVLHLPVFILIFYFIFSNSKNFLYAIILLNSLTLSPASGGLVWQTELLIRESPYGRKFVSFKDGLFYRFFLRLFLWILDIFSFWFLIKSFLFWLNCPVLLWKPLTIVAASLTLWIILIYFLLRLFVLPFLIIRKESLLNSLKKSFLIILAKPLFVFGVFVFFIIVKIFIFFTGIGFFVFYPSFFYIFTSCVTLKILSLYNSSVIFEEETRSWRHLLKPWE